MMATAGFVDHLSPPQSLLLYPTLIDQTSLSDLAPLVRNRNYHAHRDAVTRTQLDQSILANALIARLTNLLYYAHTLLVRPVVNAGPSGDNTGDFSVLNQATQELRKSVLSKCTAPAEAIGQPILSPQGSSTRFSTPTSFFDELSPTASNTLLNFLGIIRADPNFLSSRLLQAKDQELDSLASWKPRHHIARSKLVSSGRHTEAPVAPISPADYITSFHRHDPMYVLTSVIFSASPDSNSLEYLRRVNNWSTCLARLIDEKRGDRIVLAAMDIFCTGKWQVSSCFETILLGFLQNAAKLSSANPKYEDVCEEEEVNETDPEMAELFDKTLIEILGLVNDFGGIPSSAMELINAISGKCTNQDQARSVLFTKWFIEHFLSRSIIYPEYRGLLNECFISDEQRLLLQSLYSRLEKHCTSMSRQPAYESEDEHAIRTQMDALVKKFFPRDPCHQTTVDDSSGKTPQVAIVLCPSDVLTAFYALYPKHRPKQSLQAPSKSKHARKPSDESAKSEVVRLSSDLIRPILKKSHMFDLHDGSTSSQSEAEHTPSEPDSPAENDDVDMYGLSVKAAVDEMRRRLGPERCSGERHPCDDMWATLFISMDGSSLSYIPDFELLEPSNYVTEQPVVGRDEDAVIEETLLKIAGRINKINKPTGMTVESPPSPYRLKDRALQEDLILLTEPHTQTTHIPPTPMATQKSSLLSALQLATTTSFARGDYIEAQSFQQAYDLLKSVSSPHLTTNDYAPVVGTIARKIQNEGNTYLNLVRTREVWFSYLFEHRRHLEESLSEINTILSRLRCKTWYTNHVRQSKAWQRAKDVCQALHKMKSSRSGTTSSSAPISKLKRNNSALSLNRSNSMTKQESRRFLPSRQSFDGFSFSGRPASLYNVSFGMASDDWFDILAATSEQGGPHKLSDYQVDVTNRWLEEHASENFCRGEELIHRFIAEVDDVARRLVPDSADEMSVVASTFWEGEEFEEEAKEFGLIELGGRRDEYSTGRRSEEIPRNPSGVDIFGLLGRSRGKTIVAEMSDTRSIRSAHSRTTSLSVNTRPLPDVFVRPSSSHSVSFPPPSPAPSLFSRHSNLMIPMTRSASSVDEKGANQFLEVTRQRLLSLLLSDLGMEMWSAGSETDEWFTDGLADSCLDRKRRGRKKLTIRAPQKEKKLSIVPGSTRPPVRHFSLETDADLPTPPLSRETSENGKENTSNTPVSNDSTCIRGFDFKAAYMRLLTKFSVHPAPHEKLNALFELERLMTASFTNTTGGDDASTTFRGRTHFPPTPQPSPESIRKVSNSSAVGTDDLIDEIQRVLRDPRLRPKTLFRDLAFISAFVPPLTLTHHGEGKVFWDIGLAASAMKADVVNTMVDWYEEIMAGNERVGVRRGERDSRSRSAPIGKMQDAARMLVIAACEGNSVGQRELALLHLSHPSLLPLTTSPLTRPSDTFQKVSLKDVAGDKDKYDPDRIALAGHWFRLAAKNGDKYAQSVEGNWLGSST